MAERKRKSSKQARERRSRMKNNLAAILLIVVALFVALSVYFCVEQLSWLADIGKGLFGVSIYLLPVALIYIAVSVIMPETKVSTGFKIASCISIVMVVGMAFYLFCDPSYTKSLDIKLLWQGSVALKAGGVIEGIVAVPLITVISRPGLGIILAAITLFAVLALTDRTLYDLWQGIKKLFSSMRPPEKAEPEMLDTSEPDKQTDAASLDSYRHIKADIDVPIETYEVENDGLDDKGQPTQAAPVDMPPAEIAGLNVFTYNDVDPAHNIKPDEIDAESVPAGEVKAETEEAFEVPEQSEQPPYVFPTVDLLQKPKYMGGTSKDEVEYNSKKLLETLHDFGVEAKMLGVSVGPNVTRYELQPRAPRSAKLQAFPMILR